MSTADEYREALAEIERMHQAGTISDDRYAEHKANISSEAQAVRRRRLIIAGGIGTLAAVLVAAMVVAGMRDRELAEPTPLAALPADPIAQMEVAFDGYPSQREIKAVLDPAMDATNTQKTAENYSRAGSVLVGLRKDNGTPEIAILECMPSRVGDSRIPDDSFPSVAAVCSVDILEGRFEASE